MSYAVGAAPFAVAAVALLVLRWSAGRAGAATLAAAALGALLSPDLEAGAIPGSLAEGAAICARVLVILFGGLLLHNVLSRGGAVGEVTRFLDRVEPDREALALLVVLGVGPFFESVTGFGLAVVIGAPILLAAGFDPLRAAVLACWSQCAVPWGALGVGTTVGADLSGLGFGELSDVSALLSLPLFALYGLASLVLAGGAAAVRRHGAEALGLGLLAGGATLAVSVLLVPELSGALAAALAAGVFLLRRRRRLRELRPPVRAVAPYALLLILLVVATGPPAVQAAIESLGPALTGPAPWLFLSALAAAALLAVTPAASAEAAATTARQWLPVALATIGFVLSGQVIAGSGAAALLAGGAAHALGGAYAITAPVFGALGGGLTGSNVGSNALFMPLQVEAAASTGSSVALIAGIQNVAGSHASYLSPQRLVLAATATGLVGREGEIAKAAVAPVVVVVLLLAVVGIVASSSGG